MALRACESACCREEKVRGVWCVVVSLRVQRSV